MAKEYIEKRSGGYYILGKRVSLDSIIYSFLDGYSPESIVESFPAVTLEEVHGALAFYLANRPEIDNYLAEEDREFEKMRLAARAKNPSLYAKIEAARQTAAVQKQK